MARGLSAAYLTEIAAYRVAPVGFAELDFPSGFTRVCTWDRDVLWDSSGDGVNETFKGIGELGSWRGLVEGSEVKSDTVYLTLSGVSASLLSLALGQVYQGRTAKMWLGFMDASAQLILTPRLIVRGRMNTMDIINLGAQTGAAIEVSVENRLVDWERARVRRYTDADQRVRYPTDRGLEFVSQAAQRQISWGR